MSWDSAAKLSPHIAIEVDYLSRKRVMPFWQSSVIRASALVSEPAARAAAKSIASIR